MVNIVGLVLARSGSKRIPRKNIKNLCGKPLIAYTIETALSSKAFQKVVVSTDSEEIAKVAESYGAEVPWLRPPHLSTDESLSIDAVLHATRWIVEHSVDVEGVMLLQPTSPFRTKDTIWAAIKLFHSHNFQPVVSFSEVNVCPEWCFRKDAVGLSPILGWEDYKKRSQDIETTLQLNGLVYLASPDYLVEYRSFIGVSTVPLICDDSNEVIDIDTHRDWLIAEKILSS